MQTFLRTLAALALLALLAVLTAPGPLHAQTDSVGFVQLRLNIESTFPFFPAYIGEAEDPYLEFNELMALLEIAIRFNPALGSAAGFLPDDGARFDLNLERMTVQIADKVLPIPTGAIHTANGKLYVLWKQLPAWFPVQVDWSLAAYQVSVLSLFHLPSEELKERRAQRRLLLRSRAEAERIPLYEPEVPWFDWGLFGVNLSASKGNVDPAQAGVRLEGTQRFLKGDLSYGATVPYNEKIKQDATLDYVRLLYYDPMKTWEAAAGDTYVTLSPLVLELASFRGGSFYTGGRRLRYGRTTLVGIAPVGSEVDLYRLGILVDFTTVGSNGQYRFVNIPLTQRSTLYEIRIFTPDGRKLVQFQQVSAQEDMLPQGQWATQGGSGHSVAPANPYDVSAAEARFGLFEPVTLGAYVVDLQNYHVDNGAPIAKMQTAAAFAITRPLEFLTLQFEQAQDGGKPGSGKPGSGQRVNAYTSFELASLEADLRMYHGDFAPPLRTRSLQFSQPALLQRSADYVVRTQVLAANVSLELLDNDFGDERRQTDANTRIDGRITNDLTGVLKLDRVRYVEPSRAANGTNTTEVQLIYRIDALTRADVTYRHAQPTAGDSQFFAQTTYQKSVSTLSRWFYNASYNQATGVAGQVIAGLGYLFPNNFRLSGQIDSKGAWVLQVAYGVTLRVGDQGLQAFAPELYPRAGLTGTVFLDNNGDGIYEPDEETLADVKIKAPGMETLVSDRDGKFIGWGLPTDEPSNVSVDLLTVDALFVPAQDHVRVAARPGQLVRLDIPLAAAGGLDGAIALQGAPPASPLAGVELLLQGERGEGPLMTLVEWDGSFVLEGVRPGKYVLAPNPDDLRRAGYRLEPETLHLTFAAGATPTWHSGLQFRATRLPPQGPAAPSPAPSSATPQPVAPFAAPASGALPAATGSP